MFKAIHSSLQYQFSKKESVRKRLTKKWLYRRSSYTGWEAKPIWSLCSWLEQRHLLFRLLPAKMYCGAAIGISYDLRIYTGSYGTRLGSEHWVSWFTYASFELHPIHVNSMTTDSDGLQIRNEKNLFRRESNRLNNAVKWRSRAII